MASTHQSGLPDKAERNKEEFGSPECFESHLRLGRREIARDDGVGEPRGLVRAVAEGLICGVAAAAQRNGGLSRQPEGFPLRIHNFKIALHAYDYVVPDGDLSFRHFFS